MSSAWLDRLPERKPVSKFKSVLSTIGLGALVPMAIITSIVGTLLLPFLSAALFMLCYQFLDWTNWVDFLPTFGWGESFFLGGLICYGSGYIIRGSIFITPWATMLWLGAAHHQVSESIPAYGFWPLFAVYVAFIPLRLFMSLKSHRTSSND